MFIRGYWFPFFAPETGVGGGQVAGNEPDDGGQAEFEALIGGMGGNDEGSTPAQQPTNVPASTQTQRPQTPTRPQSVPPMGQSQGGQGQGPQGHGQQSVDPQVALHRLSQYETTYIPQLNRKLQEAEAQVNQLKTQGQQVQQYVETMTQFGLKPDEATIGLQMAAAYRRNPAEFLKGLINNTRAQGIDLSTLGVQPGLDPQAMNLVLDQKLKPIIDWFNQNQQQTQLQAEAEREIQEFFDRFPDAHVQQQEIAVLMQRMNMDNVNAYYQLKMWAMQNQYDWNQPLTPQILARQNGSQQQQQGNGNGFPATRRSNNYHQPVNERETEQFPVDAGWKDIARAVAASVNGS